MPDITARKNEIEDQIEHANQTITTLFEKYYMDPVNLYSNNSTEIGLLVGRLRETTRETIKVIGKIIEAVIRARGKAITQIKELDNGKLAISQYTKYQFL